MYSILGVEKEGQIIPWTPSGDRSRDKGRAWWFSGPGYHFLKSFLFVAIFGICTAIDCSFVLCMRFYCMLCVLGL